MTVSLLVRAVAVAAALVLVAGACETSHPGGQGEEPRVSAAKAQITRLDEVRGPRVVAVGDIACAPGDPVTEETCRHAETARLAASYRPKAVLGLGDLQYQRGTLREFRGSYHRTWGSLLSITRPVPGNHEYRVPDAAGYYTYFRSRTPRHPGYYTFRVGAWRIYALNSNCEEINCARQARWLDRAMTTHPRRCSAIMMHHPRFSSDAEHGNTAEVRPLWKAAVGHRTDLALSGHGHVYERFRPMTSAGDPDPAGMTAITAGAGGSSLHGFGSTVPGSLVRDNHAPGVLVLRLGKRRYAFEYRTVDGRVVDTGIRRCR